MDEHKVAEKLTQVLTGQAEVGGSIKTLCARFEAETQRTRAEMGALFASRKETQEKVSAIQRDYVPRKAMATHESEQREDLKGIGEQVAGLKVSVTRLLAGAGALFVLIQVAATWIAR